MKLAIFGLLAALSQLSGSPVAVAQENADSAIRPPFIIYRCEATGRGERGFVMGQGMNRFLRSAELGALRACQAKGGRNCRLVHCFRE